MAARGADDGVCPDGRTAAELAVLLQAREDELLAVVAAASASQADTKGRAATFFDEVVRKVKAGVAQNEELERRYREMARERDLVVVARDGLAAALEEKEREMGGVAGERDDARRQHRSCEQRLRAATSELEECRRRLSAAREAEGAAQQRVAVHVAECDAALSAAERVRTEKADAEDAHRCGKRDAEEREAELRASLRAATAAEHSAKLAMQDRERAANEQRGRAYVLEEELKKQRKKMDEYVVEEKRRLDEAREKREVDERELRARGESADRARAAAAEEASRRERLRALEAVETMRRASEVAESSARAAAADHAADVRREELAADLARSVADEIRRRFLAGVDAVKHGRAGAPKKKRIFLDPRTDELYWLAPGAPPNPAKASKRFAVATAVSVKRGKATPVFARKAAAAAPPATCLSLVNGGGDGDRDSLDLQFASKQDRDALASGLETLIARLGE